MAMNIAIHIIFALALVLIMNKVGRLSRSMGYMTFHETTQLKQFGFNLVLRILAAPVYISLLAISLYVVDVPSLVQNLWLVSVYFMVIQLLIVIAMERLGHISKEVFVMTHAMSILTSFWFYSASLKHGINSIVPSQGDFVTELWLIIIIFFYTLLNNLEIDTEKLDRRKAEDVRKKHKKFKEIYDKHLREEFVTNKLLQDFLYSVMIFEDLNRPKVVRFLERLFFPVGIVKTTGLMQTKSNKPLSDLDSLEMAQEKIMNDYKNLNGESRQKQQFNGLTYDLAKEYNGEDYAQEIESIFWVVETKK